MRILVFRLLLVLIVFLPLSCATKWHLGAIPAYSTVVIDTLLSEKMSCRALAIDGNKVWYGATNGNYGYVSLDGQPHYAARMTNANLKLEFRSIAQNAQAVFIVSIANPALLYRIDKNTKEVQLVYEEHHEKVFYDAMVFLNEKVGIAIGDPTVEGCPAIIKTIDGGTTWQKMPCTGLPHFAAGEAFFAASNTNLSYKDGKLFMVSGGVKAKVYVSTNEGISWHSYPTPIVQGSAMTGIFTADFYDGTKGIVAGGDYEKLTQNTQNKAYTTDGGKTWIPIAEGAAFGYASCVQFVPGTHGKGILAAGATGVFYSRDAGHTWQQLLADKDFIAFRFLNATTAIASGKNRIVKLTLR